MEKWPTISVCMLSYNDDAILGDCLKSIRGQDYPQDKIEILMLDGGSTDGTERIAKEYNAVFVSRPDLKSNVSERGEILYTLPKSDLVMAFSADNRFLESDCLDSMVEALSNPEIVACETLKYGLRGSDPVLSRYFALIGGVDPIAIGLGKADRMPHDVNTWESF